MTRCSLLYFLLILTLLGCAHLESVSTSSVPVDRSTPVESQTTRFLFLLLNFDNDYVNALSQDLARKCPKGRVEGILTKQEFITYFPLLAHEIRVTASGYCVGQGTGQ